MIMPRKPRSTSSLSGPEGAKPIRVAPKPRRAPRPRKAPVVKGDGLRIVMIASEAQPFSKTGGLADVAGALPRALGRLGHDVTVVTPRYRGVDGGKSKVTVSVGLAGRAIHGDLIEMPLAGGVRAVLVDCPALYDRSGIYGEGGTDYPDNPVRFAFLVGAALRWASLRPEPPQIVHGHDWQAGLLGPYVRAAVRAELFGHRRARGGQAASMPDRPGTVFTIHNLAYQGLFDKSWTPQLGLSWDDFTLDGFEYWDRLSFLKSGINFSDVVTTVSPTYAQEIQRREYGHGFDTIVRARREALVGILNGIDTDEWNPATDPHLPAPFDAEHLSGKARSKRAVLEAFGLPADQAAMARPLVGMVSRMVDQKGLDLIAAVASQLANLEATFVIVGTGLPRYQDMWSQLARWRPDRIGVFVGFDERRAHLVEAGADVFLMPSRFEPCGLNQMYSMRYGTVPVVRAVGGLVDTVRPYDPARGTGTGFLFSEYHPMAMLRALVSALEAFHQKEIWTRLQENGMRTDFSWDRSAAEYVKVYEAVRAPRR